jgi:hypothetical protein
MHFLRPDKNMLRCFVSEYAVGKYSWLMTFAFYALASSAALMLGGLMMHLKASKTAVITLIIFCLGILLAAIFPTDIPGDPPTPRGLIHGFAALIAFINIGISMIAWGVVFKKNNNFISLAKSSIIFGVTSLVLLLIFIFSPVSIRGLTQRILLTHNISWLFLVSLKMYQEASSDTKSTMAIH